MYQYIFYAFPAWAALSSKKFILYNEETLVLICFVSFVFLIKTYASEDISSIFEQYSSAIKENLIQGFRNQEVQLEQLKFKLQKNRSYEKAVQNLQEIRKLSISISWRLIASSNIRAIQAQNYSNYLNSSFSRQRIEINSYQRPLSLSIFDLIVKLSRKNKAKKKRIRATCISKIKRLKYYKLDMSIKNTRDFIIRKQVAQIELHRRQIKSICYNRKLSQQFRINANLMNRFIMKSVRVTRIRNRCPISRYAQSPLRFFQLGRQKAVLFMRQGLIPGVRKLLYF